VRMSVRWAWIALAAVSGGLIGVAEAKPPHNSANEYLLKLPENQRAAWLARTVGNWCVATEPFLMGVAQNGAGAGNAYWSFRCIEGGSFVVQLDPLGGGVAIDCETFKEDGGGKECFKRF
jgi:hypothetical protein